MSHGVRLARIAAAIAILVSVVIFGLLARRDDERRDGGPPSAETPIRSRTPNEGAPAEGGRPDPSAIDPRPVVGLSEHRSVALESDRLGAGAPSLTPAPTSQRIDEEVDEVITKAFDLLDQEDFEAARAAARECLGLNPEVLDCHHALVFSFTRKAEYGGELSQALRDCLEISPKDPECLETLVLADIRNGDLKGARAALAAREAIPLLPPDYLGEAFVFKAEGDMTTACKNFASACTLSQQFACRMQKELCAFSSTAHP